VDSLEEGFPLVDSQEDLLDLGDIQEDLHRLKDRQWMMLIDFAESKHFPCKYKNPKMLNVTIFLFL